MAASMLNYVGGALRSPTDGTVPRHVGQYAGTQSQPIPLRAPKEVPTSKGSFGGTPQAPVADRAGGYGGTTPPVGRYTNPRHSARASVHGQPHQNLYALANQLMGGQPSMAAWAQNPVIQQLIAQGRIPNIYETGVR